MTNNKPKPDRDRRLLEFLARYPGRGANVRAARKFHISRERVRQIVRREVARRAREEARPERIEAPEAAGGAR